VTARAVICYVPPTHMGRLAVLFAVLCASTARAQEGPAPTAVTLGLLAGLALQDDWENKIIEEVRARGFRLLRPKNLLDTLHARKGARYTVAKRKEDVEALYTRRFFDDVRITVEPGSARESIVVTVEVVEAPVVNDVLFTGLAAIPLSTLRPKLRINPGDRLSMHYLKLDRDVIREEYLVKGYAFSSVEEEVVPTATGVALHWRIHEGPLVGVREIVFTGNASVPSGTIKDFMITKENSFLLFIPTGTNPFVRRFLDEDIKRIRLYYQLEGWLDIGDGDRVFVQDLEFSEDKTEVTIRIHVDEGRRYRIRKLEFRGNTVLTPTDFGELVRSRMGAEFNERVAQEDARRLRDRYGERAYILAEVIPTYMVDLEKRELDLVFEIKENQKMRIGRITVAGNHKTRVDVILRELKDFAPGEEFNSRKLTRGLNRLRDRGYFEPGGLNVRYEPGAAPDEQDVVVDVREGQTGNIRFAGGYSSSFGILGIIELSQKNFDITDLPSSFGDFFNGTAFAGGGQFFSLKLSPSAKRQTITIDFREPYVFGMEYGLGVRGYNTRTEREDWDENRLGGRLTLDKRLGDFRIDLTVNTFRIEIDDVDGDAPSSVKGLEGTNRIFSITPSITWSTLDSPLFPSEGFRVMVSYEHAGDVLPGDFDFYKIILDADLYFTVLEVGDTIPKLKHVLQFHLRAERMDELDDSKSVPFFERAYAGGRESIRGFEYRGVGPKENGDPVGGEGYVFASVEYSFPLIVEFLRGAVFFDVANIAPEWADLRDTTWRQTIGFGIRFIIPQLGNVPVALDFGFPIRKDDDDERQTVTFDIGKLF